MKKEIKFIELPGLPQQTTKKGEYLSTAKDDFGYKVKRVVVTGAASGMGYAAKKRYVIGAGVKGGEQADLDRNRERGLISWQGRFIRKRLKHNNR